MYISLPLFERLYRDDPANKGKACEPETKVSFGLVLSTLLLLSCFLSSFVCHPMKNVLSSSLFGRPPLARTMC